MSSSPPPAAPAATAAAAPSSRPASLSFDEARGTLRLLDQRRLPHAVEFVDCRTPAEVAAAIRAMVVRGAPAIGAAGAFGMALARDGDLAAAKALLDAARPTAVNLMHATARVLAAGAARALAEARAIMAEDVRINRALGAHGAALVPAGANVLHHCNTGALATCGHGTALGIIYTCTEQKKDVHVWVDETRPRLQGARLTAWELLHHPTPIRFHLIADSAAGSLIRRGQVDVVVFGADRVAANGDVANKVGTYSLCVLARERKRKGHAITVICACPTPTIDLDTRTGDEIEIEERAAEEVLSAHGTRVAPEGCEAYNPAFDVTPAEYIDYIVTEKGVLKPPFEQSIAELFGG